MAHTPTSQYAHLLGRRWNDLEFEEQAHVRSLLRAGLVTLRCDCDCVPLADRYVARVQNAGS